MAGHDAGITGHVRPEYPLAEAVRGVFRISGMGAQRRKVSLVTHPMRCTLYTYWLDDSDSKVSVCGFNSFYNQKYI